MERLSVQVIYKCTPVSSSLVLKFLTLLFYSKVVDADDIQL
jgi:hypothetical protein